MFSFAFISAAFIVQICSGTPEGGSSKVPCPLIMCPLCPEGYHTERPWTEDIDCSLISCKCIPDVPKIPEPPKKACPMISCPGGRMGNCRKSDGCFICDCLPLCPPVPPCPKECNLKTRIGCPYCHCPVKPPSCPLPMCAMHCQYGLEVDEKGCTKCKCRKCPRQKCRMSCKEGFQVDKNGCEICKCKSIQKPKCSPYMCRMHCELGFEVDENGCEICKCRKCPMVLCTRFCRFGFKVNKYGCQTCRCRRVPVEWKGSKVGPPSTQG